MGNPAHPIRSVYGGMRRIIGAFVLVGMYTFVVLIFGAALDINRPRWKVVQDVITIIWGMLLLTRCVATQMKIDAQELSVARKLYTEEQPQ